MHEFLQLESCWVADSRAVLLDKKVSIASDVVFRPRRLIFFAFSEVLRALPCHHSDDDASPLFAAQCTLHSVGRSCLRGLH